MTVDPTKQLQDLIKHAGYLAASYKSTGIEIDHLLLALPL